MLQAAAAGLTAHLVPLKKQVDKYAAHTVWLGLAITSVHSLTPHKSATFEHYLLVDSLNVPHYVKFPLNTEQFDELCTHPAPFVTQPVKNAAHYPSVVRVVAA